jgi:hypothetical protein
MVRLIHKAGHLKGIAVGHLGNLACKHARVCRQIGGAGTAAQQHGGDER